MNVNIYYSTKVRGMCPLPHKKRQQQKNKKAKTTGGTSLALQIPQPMIFDLNDMPAVCFGHLFPPSALKTFFHTVKTTAPQNVTDKT